MEVNRRIRQGSRQSQWLLKQSEKNLLLFKSSEESKLLVYQWFCLVSCVASFVVTLPAELKKKHPAMHTSCQQIKVKAKMKKMLARRIWQRNLEVSPLFRILSSNKKCLMHPLKATSIVLIVIAKMYSDTKEAEEKRWRDLTLLKIYLDYRQRR